MAVRYLLDTNTASYVIKGNLPRVRERLQQAALSEVAISAITEAELRLGVLRLPEATVWRSWSKNFSALSIFGRGTLLPRRTMLSCGRRSSSRAVPWEIWT